MHFVDVMVVKSTVHLSTFNRKGCL